MNPPVSTPIPDGMNENPWRTVLEYQLGFGPPVRDRSRPREHSAVRGLVAGLAVGATGGVAFLLYLHWLLG